VKWKKSFLLHPWFNRFNLLYLAVGLTATVALPVDNLGWFVLGGEVLYLAVRALIDRGANPWLRLRRLPYRERHRFIAAWAAADRAEQDLRLNDNLAAALSASREQVERLLQSFLELLLLRQRIDHYLRFRQTDYAAEIAKARSRMAGAAEHERQLLQNNISVLEKRRKVYQDLFKRQQSIDSRLDAIENSLKLISEAGVGLIDPGEVTGQVEVILSNVEDAENFVNEMNEVVLPLRVR